mgnify:CR=1 FL=1
MNMKIGMLTSGGDCQGLNAALRGVAKTLYNEMGKGVTLYGIRDGYRGLIEGDYHEMKPDDFSDILTLGGTILGTSRQPFKQMQRPEEDSEQTKLDKMLKTVKKAGFDCLVILGGNGTHKTANLLRENGVNVDRNWLKNDESVTTKRQKPSGRNWPNRMPTMMAMMSLGSNPSLNFFFSSISFLLLDFAAQTPSLYFSVCCRERLPQTLPHFGHKKTTYFRQNAVK